MKHIQRSGRYLVGGVVLLTFVMGFGAVWIAQGLLSLSFNLDKMNQ